MAQDAYHDLAKNQFPIKNQVIKLSKLLVIQNVMILKTAWVNDLQNVW